MTGVHRSQAETSFSEDERMSAIGEVNLADERLSENVEPASGIGRTNKHNGVQCLSRLIKVF